MFPQPATFPIPRPLPQPRCSRCLTVKMSADRWAEVRTSAKSDGRVVASLDGRKDKLVRQFSAQDLQSPLQSAELPFGVGARISRLQPLQQLTAGEMRLGARPLPNLGPSLLKWILARSPPRTFAGGRCSVGRGVPSFHAVCSPVASHLSRPTAGSTSGEAIVNLREQFWRGNALTFVAP